MPVEVVNGIPVPIAKKPVGCTCEFPVVVFKNGCGHDPDCPSYHAWRKAKKAAKVNKDPEADAVVAEQGTPAVAPSSLKLTALFGSRMILPEYELVAAVQYYLENVVFRAGCAPQVQSVWKGEDEDEFEVRFGPSAPTVKKPANCTCQFPMAVFQNGSGHDPECLVHKVWREVEKAMLVNKGSNVGEAT